MCRSTPNSYIDKHTYPEILRLVQYMQLFGMYVATLANPAEEYFIPACRTVLDLRFLCSIRCDLKSTGDAYCNCVWDPPSFTPNSGGQFLVAHTSCNQTPC